MDLNILRQLRLQRYSGGSAAATSASSTTSSSDHQAYSHSSDAYGMQASHGMYTGAALASVPSALPTAAVNGTNADAGAGGSSVLSHQSNHAIVQPSGSMQSDASMFALLAEVRDLLVALPATIAGALAAAQTATPAHLLTVTPTTTTPQMTTNLCTTVATVPNTVVPFSVPFVPQKPPVTTSYAKPVAAPSALVTASVASPQVSSEVPPLSYEVPTQQFNAGNGAGTMSGGYDGGNDDMCGVCHMPIFATDQHHAYVRCGHYPFCSACVNKVSKTKQCPFCKTEGDDVVLLFEE